MMVSTTVLAAIFVLIAVYLCVAAVVANSRLSVSLVYHPRSA
jgi:hypothetical protein